MIQRTILALLLACLAAPATAQSLCLCLKCATGAYRSFHSTGGSMKPTILPGQCFIARTSFAPDDLVPGTIITFRHPTDGQEWFKRIVAIGGQSVQMVDGRLMIDDAPVPVRENGLFIETFEAQGPQGLLPRCANGTVPIGADCIKTRLTETLGGSSYDILDIGTQQLDNTGLFQVPDGHVFVLGDNRDNSNDSRVPVTATGVGFVPIGNVTGVLDEVRP